MGFVVCVTLFISGHIILYKYKDKSVSKFHFTLRSIWISFIFIIGFFFSLFPWASCHGGKKNGRIVSNQVHMRAAFCVPTQAFCPKLKIADTQKAQTNGCGWPGFKFLLHHLPFVWPWANYFKFSLLLFSHLYQRYTNIYFIEMFLE